MTSWIVPGGILLVAALVVARWLWRSNRRKTLLATPLTSQQRATVEKLVPLVGRLQRHGFEIMTRQYVQARGLRSQIIVAALPEVGV